MDLPRDLIELFLAFDTAAARYLLVEGHAVSLGPERADVERACAALSAFGVPREIVEALRALGARGHRVARARPLAN